MARRETCRGGAQGLTLIELLTAMAVSALIVAASVGVYLAISGSLRRHAGNPRGQVLAALDVMRRDLACCSHAFSSNSPLFAVAPDAATNAVPASTLLLTTGELPGPEDDFGRLLVRRHRYRLALTAVGAEGGLIRETTTLFGGDAVEPAATHRVAQGMTAFTVEVLAGDQWTNAWQSSAREAFPKAVRVSLGWGAAPATGSVSMVVFVPAGNTPVAVDRPRSKGE
jgi:prepilin-type N-terminal cleavage/methylation domain-containing protein